MTARAVFVAALALGLLPSGAAFGEAQQRWVEAVGVARAEPGEGPGGPGRQAALRAALAEAVQQVAVELLAAAETSASRPPQDPAALAEKASRALGGDPSAYIARYQIREDRGVKPRLLLSDPEATAEYQLVVAAQVDVAKVRQRIGVRAPATPDAEGGGAAKPLTPETLPKAAEAGASTFDVELEALTSYKEYAAVREALLGKLGVTRAAPVEFSRGRAVLTLDSPIPASQLAVALGKALDGQIAIESLPSPSPGAPEGRLRLRVRAAPSAIPAPAGLTR